MAADRDTHIRGAKIFLHGSSTLTSEVASDMNLLQGNNNGPRERTALAYAKKYIEAANGHNELAGYAHGEQNYQEAANHLNRADEEYRSLNHMLHYNLGAEHPLSQRWNTFVDERMRTTASYAQTMQTRDPSLASDFENIMRNNNLNGNQFGDQ
jgi:hypothetical protein